jgi:hypothetical protein
MNDMTSIGLVLLAGATCLVVISIVFVVQHARKREPRSSLRPAT